MVAINPNDAGVYTELNQLQQLKSKSNRNDPEALKKVAKDFEQIFLSMMLKSMRDANAVLSKDNFLNSSQLEFFQEMRDEQLSLELAHKGGIGLAEVLVKQLSGVLHRAPSQGASAEKGFSIQGEDVPRPVSVEPAPLQGEQPELKSLLKPVVTGAEHALQGFVSNLAQQREYGAQSEVPSVASGSSGLPEQFNSPEQFVATLRPMADAAAEKLGVDSQVLIAQAALETGWGRHISRDEQGRSSYNLFNIKADRRWSGERLDVNTTEYRNGVAQAEVAAFRQYNSYQQSFDDYVAFIKSSPRYQQALEQAGNSRRYLDELQNAGYATDPRYADKIHEISRRPLMLAMRDHQAH